MAFDETHTQLAKENDEQASNPDWNCYYDRPKNKWIPYGMGEFYSKQARVIVNISRGYYTQSFIDTYLNWVEPEHSLTGISATLEGYLVAKHSKNTVVMEYLDTFIPEKYKHNIQKYYDDWFLSKSHNHQ